MPRLRLALRPRPSPRLRCFRACCPSPPTARPRPAPSRHAATAARDSLAYGYYGQTLGVRLAHTENKSLLCTITNWLGTPYSYGSQLAPGHRLLRLRVAGIQEECTASRSSAARAPCSAPCGGCPKTR
ncbi:MAG: hypothetical protein WKG07_14685 [Hymenobacter sp.]